MGPRLAATQWEPRQLERQVVDWVRRRDHKVNVPQAWAAGMGRASARLAATQLFEANELDFMALAANKELGITVLKPGGKRVGAQLPSV